MGGRYFQFNPLSILSSGLILFSFFPFIGLKFLGTDTQPFAHLLMLAAIFGILFNDKYLVYDRLLNYFIISLLCGGAYLMLNINLIESPDLFQGIRSMLSLMTVPLFIFCIFNINLSNLKDLFLFSYFTWFAFGLIQFALFEDFGEFLLARQTTTEDRGVTSLATEPVEYARAQICMMIISTLFYAKNIISKRLHMLTLILSSLQIIVFGLSGLGAVFLLFYFLCYFVFIYQGNQKLLILLIFLLGSIFFVIVGLTLFEDRRLFYLINIVVNNPDLIMNYGGFAQRFFNLPNSLYVGIYHSMLFGNGLAEQHSTEMIKFTFFGLTYENIIYSRAHGGVIGLIYEIGIFSFPWILGYFLIFYLYVTKKEQRLNLFVLFA